MVDRITPLITEADRLWVSEQFGLQDRFPVMAEPFLQWVIEDEFCAGRPALEKVGVQYTSDVQAYELIKLRLLNASHLLIGYLGLLLGYTYVHEVMADTQCCQVVRALMEEVTPTLKPVEGIVLSEYKETLLERFKNPKICDRVSRLCMESAVKVPKFLLGSLRNQLEQGGEITLLSLTLAFWSQCLKGYSEQGEGISIEDSRSDRLIQAVRQGNGDDPRPLLNLSEIFGEDLGQASSLIKVLGFAIVSISEVGVRETIAKTLTLRS